MNILFWGIGLFLLAFFIHIFMWRIHLPKNHTKALFGIFLGALLIGIFILWKFQAFENQYQYLQFSLLFVSLSLAYIATYPAAEADSPSLAIVQIISKANPKGVTKEELNKIMTNEFLVKPRVNDLLLYNMISLKGDRYTITRKGIFLVRIFIFYRKLLDIQQGG